MYKNTNAQKTRLVGISEGTPFPNKLEDEVDTGRRIPLLSQAKPSQAKSPSQIKFPGFLTSLMDLWPGHAFACLAFGVSYDTVWRTAGYGFVLMLVLSWDSFCAERETDCDGFHFSFSASIGVSRVLDCSSCSYAVF